MGYRCPIFLLLRNEKLISHAYGSLFRTYILITIGASFSGIWGGKGQGKSFQTELIFQVMGIEPVIMSAGELESERAGMKDSLLVLFPCFI